MEMFQAFGFAERVKREAYWVNETVFWRPGAQGGIGRAIVDRLVADGAITPVIDRQFALAETADAIRYSETGRARGKILIRID